MVNNYVDIANKYIDGKKVRIIDETLYIEMIEAIKIIEKSNQESIMQVRKEILTMYSEASGLKFSDAHTRDTLLEKILNLPSLEITEKK